VIKEAFWEVKLDIALVLFALAFSLYMDSIMGIVGLRSAARLGAVTRAGLKSGSRVTAWERSLRFFFLTVDGAAQFMRTLIWGKSRSGLTVPDGELIPPKKSKTTHSIPVLGRWTSSWTRGDWLTLVFGLFCLLLIVAAPWFGDHTGSSVIATLRSELRPFPVKP
jgi:hypothetical protein